MLQVPRWEVLSFPWSLGLWTCGLGLGFLMLGIFRGSLLIILLTGIFFTMGCKKEAGIIGKKVVKGTVYFKNGVTGTNDPAASAVVYVTYGATVASSCYNQTTTTDAGGEYIIKGLQKGDYFITADYTDSHGFKYTTPGYAVTIQNKKNELQLDIVLE